MIYQFDRHSTTATSWKNSARQDHIDHLRDVKKTAEILNFMKCKNFKSDKLTRLVVASDGMDYELLSETGFYD